MVTVTGAIQDLVADGVTVSHGQLDVSLALPVLDDAITTRNPFTVTAVDGVFTFEVPASEDGNAYRLWFRGIPGLRMYWVRVPDAAVTLSELLEAHLVDPSTFDPVAAAPTVRAELDALDTRVTDLEDSGGATDEQVESAVTSYLTANPITVDSLDDSDVPSMTLIFENGLV